MKRILGAAITLALVLGIVATSFAGVGPKTNTKAPAAKSAMLLKNKVKQTKHRKHRRMRRIRRMRRHHRRHKGK